VGAWLCCRAVPLWATLGHTGPSSRAAREPERAGSAQLVAPAS
jgi:hypothetical protein